MGNTLKKKRTRLRKVEERVEFERRYGNEKRYGEELIKEADAISKYWELMERKKRMEKK